MRNFYKKPLFFANLFLLSLIFLFLVNINLDSTKVPSFIQRAVAAVSGILGEGSVNHLAAFDGTNQIGNSLIYDTGSNIGIGTANPNYELEVNGAIRGNYVGTSARTYLYQDGLCLNGDCRDSWPSGGGGGVSKIIAGSNITISPASGTGDVTISSNGGGITCITKTISGAGQVNCDAGYTMTGGGINGTGNYVDATYPSGNGWVCRGAMAHGCYVRCCK